jgi:hypothetical protein
MRAHSTTVNLTSKLRVRARYRVDAGILRATRESNGKLLKPRAERVVELRRGKPRQSSSTLMHLDASQHHHVGAELRLQASLILICPPLASLLISACSMILGLGPRRGARWHAGGGPCCSVCRVQANGVRVDELLLEEGLADVWGGNGGRGECINGMRVMARVLVDFKRELTLWTRRSEGDLKSGGVLVTVVSQSEVHV